MSPWSPPLTVAAVRELVARYAVRNRTPFGSGACGTAGTAGLRTTCRSPTPAQVIVTVREAGGSGEGDDDRVGGPEGSVTEGSAAAGVRAIRDDAAMSAT
jgi:hypothetical protein